MPSEPTEPGPMPLGVTAISWEAADREEVKVGCPRPTVRSGWIEGTVPTIEGVLPSLGELLPGWEGETGTPNTSSAITIQDGFRTLSPNHPDNSVFKPP